MSFPRIRSLDVGIPGLVNSVAQICLQILSLIPLYHPLCLDLSHWVGFSSWSQGDPKMVSRADSQVLIFEREKASQKCRFPP